MKQSQSNADASLWPTWANKTIRKKISISAKLLKLFLFSTNLSGAEIKTFIHSLFYDEDELRWASYITVTYKMTKIVLKVLDHPSPEETVVIASLWPHGPPESTKPESSLSQL